MAIEDIISKKVPDRAAHATGKASCRECGKELTGRSDKRYCSGKCHDAFNNRVKAQRRQDEQSFLRPAQASDCFLAELFKVDPNKEWPQEVLKVPQFHGDAPRTRIKDDRSPFPGNRFINYSYHINPQNNTFTILNHGNHNV